MSFIFVESGMKIKVSKFQGFKVLTTFSSTRPTVKLQNNIENFATLPLRSSNQ